MFPDVTMQLYVHKWTFTISGVDFWFNDLKKFLREKKGILDWRKTFSSNYTDTSAFRTFLSDFLFHKEGGESKQSFMFEEDLVCGEPAFKINVSKKYLQ
jgi:hypothetical protein